ncbi:MAG: hypothetical protein HQM14_16025 [SAR324 cluster bacterium]|nr:hypothetical protein [SAR324 cluster bacterium]
MEEYYLMEANPNIPDEVIQLQTLEAESCLSIAEVFTETTNNQQEWYYARELAWYEFNEREELKDQLSGNFVAGIPFEVLKSAYQENCFVVYANKNPRHCQLVPKKIANSWIFQVENDMSGEGYLKTIEGVRYACQPLMRLKIRSNRARICIQYSSMKQRSYWKVF